jgi:hypothetical protein
VTVAQQLAEALVSILVLLLTEALLSPRLQLQTDERISTVVQLLTEIIRVICEAERPGAGVPTLGNQRLNG